MTRVFLLIACAGVLVSCAEPPPPPPTTTQPAPAPSPAQAPLFRDVASDTGLQFENFIGATGQYYFIEIMGAGGALVDYDSDGDLDVYLVQSSMPGGGNPADALFPAPSSHWPGNRLFRNDLNADGKLTFSDVTEQAGVGDTGYGMGVAIGDVDGDGHTDLYVTNFGPNVFYRNLGDGSFVAMPDAAGANDDRWSTSAAFLDYDADGDLDLYVASYVSFSLQYNKRCNGNGGQQDYCSPSAYTPLTDRLFRNDGDFKFTDVSAASGIGSAVGSGLGVSCADFNGDGLIDIYVANDQLANLLWINRGDGTFEETALMVGAAYNAHGVAEASMGVTAGDFDGDGDEDLFMTHLAQQTNTLYANNGQGVFTDATDRSRLGSASMPFTGFGTRWFDYDNDGALDIIVVNGAVVRVKSQMGRSAYPYAQSNQLFHNDGNAQFSDRTAMAGEAFAMEEVSRGTALGDIDNDGDVDALITNNNGPVRLLLNEAAGNARWLQVDLQGTSSNRDGIGAKVGVLRDGQDTLWRRAHTDGSYVSASDERVYFGLDDSESIVGVQVHWPSGLREVWRDIKVNSRVTLVEGDGEKLL